MPEVRLVAQARTEFGKGAARRIRRAGQVPAVLYGHGSEPRHLSLSARALSQAIRGGANTVLTLDVDGTSELALAKSVVRHPLRDYIEHADLLLVKSGERVTVEVQVVHTGIAVSGSLILTDMTHLTIEVDALSIPERLEVDLGGLEIGTQVLAGAVSLPEGVRLVTDPEALVVAVQAAPTAEAESGEGAVEGEVTAETAGGEAAEA